MIEINALTTTQGWLAAREGKAERHIRLLAPLAFVSPRIIAALIDGTAPADLTVAGLARTLPYSWAEQSLRWRRSCSMASASTPA